MTYRVIDHDGENERRIETFDPWMAAKEWARATYCDREFAETARCKVFTPDGREIWYGITTEVEPTFYAHLDANGPSEATS